MDAFEELVAEVLRAEGYWVHQGYKIYLTREEKQALGDPSMPRPEIDLVAYKAGTGELLSLECKSYFDSGGVHARDLLPGGKNAQRYKMFVNADLRRMVLKKLVEQLVDNGSVAGIPTPRLGMIYGFATRANTQVLETHFAQSGWDLYGPDWLRAHLQKMALRSYDNQVASVVAKLLLPRTTGSRLEVAA
ncbi:hypothetical protein M2336_001242 [Sphingobium sp. B1D7B]|uniref:hypothetical protein n=1 Tax=Sphingobium sp. B1D7B TaxID=2940578 RepID=UPI0022253FD6|nr:hypothetical protein [Sphingobium sp. B1D7B]MCW2404613.1 hypothetical protein [Sphingobium sp. B1D7B]